MVTHPSAAFGRITLLAVLAGGVPWTAAAATISFETSAYYQMRGRAANTNYEIIHVSLGPSANFSLPGFDSSLGTLTSARLDLDGVMVSRLFTHAGAPLGTVATLADLTMHGSIGSPTLLFPGVSLRTEHPLTGAGGAGFPPFTPAPYFENTTIVSATGGLHQTFTGSTLSAFTHEIGFSVNPPHPDYVFHQGGLLTELLTFPDPSDMQPGTRPGAASVALLVARIANIVLGDDDHPLIFSDMHIAAGMQWDMKVTYTYEPAPVPVQAPEPSPLLLLGAALTALPFCRGSLSRLRRRQE